MNMGKKEKKYSQQKKRGKKKICILEHKYAVFSNWKKYFRHNIKIRKYKKNIKTLIKFIKYISM